jgi:hypothetical protein
MVTVEGTGGLGDETKVEAKEERDDTADFETDGDSKTENNIKKQKKKQNVTRRCNTSL